MLFRSVPPTTHYAERIKFIYMGERARAESIVQLRQPGLVETFTRSALSGPDSTAYSRERGFGSTLFQLLVPSEFKAAARKTSNLILVVDGQDRYVGSNTKDVEGRYAVLSLHVSRNSGVGARASGAALPTAGNQGYAEERVPMKRNYASIEIAGDLIEASGSDRASFGRQLDLDASYEVIKDAVERAGLTNREREVLGLLATGSSTRAVAEELGVSTDTARTHVQRILSKLDAHSRLEAVAEARRRGLLS